MHVIRRFHYEISGPGKPDVVTYLRHVQVRRASPESNHASGTAVAIRPGWYPPGVRGGFFPHEVTVIRDILAECEGVVRWGGDDDKPYEAQFYIDVPPGDDRLARLVAKLRRWADRSPHRPPSRRITCTRTVSAGVPGVSRHRRGTPSAPAMTWSRSSTAGTAWVNMGDAVGTARRVGESLDEEGSQMIVEPRAGDPPGGEPRPGGRGAVVNPPTVPVPGQVLEDETLRAVQRFQEAVNRRDIAALVSAMTEDCVFESTQPPDGDRYQGEGVRGFFEDLFTSARNRHFEVEEIIVAGDRATLRWLHRWEDAASGERHVRGVDVFRVRSGRVAEKLSYVKG